jgi:hypothetical protein
VREQLKEIRPFPAVFDSRYVLRIEAAHRKDCVSLGEATEQVREDMRTFKSEHGLDRAVMIHCASTAAYAQPQKAHFDLDEFEAALERRTLRSLRRWSTPTLPSRRVCLTPTAPRLSRSTFPPS